MQANKPRYSVLHMFDPLASPSTPLPREPSPESSSDKENDVLPGELTAFFTRTYTTHNHETPKTPKGRLIDIGDPTTEDLRGVAGDGDPTEDEPFKNTALTEERLLDEPLNLNDELAQSPFERRIPLAEIELEEPPKQKTQAAALTVLDSLPASIITRAPSSSPLSEVINSINLDALTISAPERSSPLANHCIINAEKGEGDHTPQITVDSPTSLNSSVHPPLDRVAAQEQPTPSFAPPKRRTATNLDDPRRRSLDLHASFSLHMQSEELSFDLMNDKMSFLGQAPDSFWAGADDGNSGMEMEAIVEELQPFDDKEEEEDEEQDAEQAERTEEQTTATAAPFSVSLKERADNADAQDYVSRCAWLETEERNKPVFFLPVHQAVSAESVHDTNASRASTHPTASTPSVAPSLHAEFPKESKPAPAAVALNVPALRIVKKTWKMRGRTDSTASASSATSTASSASTSSSGSTASARYMQNSRNKPTPAVPFTNVDAGKSSSTQLSVASLSFSRSTSGSRAPIVARGVQRPRVPSDGRSDKTAAAPASVPEDTQQQASTHEKNRASLEAAAKEAARRFAAAGIQRPNIQKGERPPPSVPIDIRSRHQKTLAPLSSVCAPATRAVRPNSTAASVPKVGRSASSGLKPPSCFGNTAPGASSALPRPASRLPAAAPTRGIAVRRDGRPGAGALAVSGSGRGGMVGAKRTL